MLLKVINKSVFISSLNRNALNSRGIFWLRLLRNSRRYFNFIRRLRRLLGHKLQLFNGFKFFCKSLDKLVFLIGRRLINGNILWLLKLCNLSSQCLNQFVLFFRCRLINGSILWLSQRFILSSQCLNQFVLFFRWSISWLFQYSDLSSQYVDKSVLLS